MRKLYKLWLADTGWNRYTKKQKAMVIWWVLSFIAVMISPAAPTFTSFAYTFIISAISFTEAGMEVFKNIKIEE